MRDTQQVMDACVDAGVHHVTAASSGAVYADSPRNRGRAPVESDPVPGHPCFVYSRHEAEVEARLAARRLQARGGGT